MILINKEFALNCIEWINKQRNKQTEEQCLDLKFSSISSAVESAIGIVKKMNQKILLTITEYHHPKYSHPKYNYMQCSIIEVNSCDFKKIISSTLTDEDVFSVVDAENLGGYVFDIVESDEEDNLFILTVLSWGKYDNILKNIFPPSEKYEYYYR